MTSLPDLNRIEEELVESYLNGCDVVVQSTGVPVYYVPRDTTDARPFADLSEHRYLASEVSSHEIGRA